jgi:hypothetical protein
MKLENELNNKYTTLKKLLDNLITTQTPKPEKCNIFHPELLTVQKYSWMDAARTFPEHMFRH